VPARLLQAQGRTLLAGVRVEGCQASCVVSCAVPCRAVWCGVVPCCLVCAVLVWCPAYDVYTTALSFSNALTTCGGGHEAKLYVLKQRLVVCGFFCCLVFCCSCNCSYCCPVAVSRRVRHPTVFVQCCCSMMKYLTTGGLILLMSVVRSQEQH
jgi:hypothetical protein